MPAERVLPTSEARDLIALPARSPIRSLRRAPAEHEAEARFPREVFRLLGEAGLLSLPYPEEFGGSGQPYEVYLQALEEIAARWASVAVGVSVHSLTCSPTGRLRDSRSARARVAGDASGRLLGAYCPSEPHAGFDPGAMIHGRSTREASMCSGYEGLGDHGGRPTSTRCSPHVRGAHRGISCSWWTGDHPGCPRGT